MKNILLFLVLSTLQALSQETKQLELCLQREVNKELQNQFKSDWYEGDTLVIIQNFTLKDSLVTSELIEVDPETFDEKEHRLIQTEIKVLSYVLKHRFYYGGGYQIEKQEVDLKEITAIAKDVQILFETTPNAVKITRINYYDDGRIETVTDHSNLFFTQLKCQRGNEGLGYQLQELFEKAGYKIEISHWYD